MKPKLSRQQMMAVGIAMFGLVLGLGSYMILVAPLKSKAVALSGAVDAAQSSLYVVQHNPHVEKPKPPDVGAADLFRLTKAMPDSEDVPGILLSLMRLAKDSSLVLSSIGPPATLPTPSPTGYTVLPVSVTVHGKFANVANFLQQLRGSVAVVHDKLKVTNRLFIPNTISLTPDPDGVDVDASITLSAFVYGKPAPVAAPTDTPSTGTTTTASTG